MAKKFMDEHEEDRGDFSHTKTRYVEKAHFNQSIRSEGPPDKSAHHINETESLLGRDLAGGVLDLSHSIGAGGQVETYNDVKAKPRPFRSNGKINGPETK